MSRKNKSLDRILAHLEDIKAKRMEGMTIREIERFYSLGIGSIRRAFDSLGIAIVKLKPGRKRMTVDSDDFTKEMIKKIGWELRFRFHKKLQEAFFVTGVLYEKIAAREKLLQRTIGKTQLAEISTMDEFRTVYHEICRMLGEQV